MSGLERNHRGEMVRMIFLCNKNGIFRFQPPIFQGVMEVELGGRIFERYLIAIGEIHPFFIELFGGRGAI